ncbi:TonB-dependent receptor [Aurantiacibacter marinus]|nr:TonB-dependent receptor [Aurantiacibacter marinus]
MPLHALAQDQQNAEEASRQPQAAGQQTAPPVTVASPPAAEDQIVVTGIRASLEDALDIRRNADVILDGISSDDIGSTPDLNLGEALARIPGVQINREAGRRDATISVRGLPGRFTKTTIMGQTIASTTRGNNTGNPFGIFESAIFNGANVIKSFTADTPSGGLAAQVDLRLTGALDRRDGFVARAELGYEETTQDWNPAFFVSGAEHLSDRFALYGAVAYSAQSFRRDTFRVNAYNAFGQAQIDGIAAGTSPSGIGETVGLVANPAFDISAVGANGLDNAVIFPREIRQFVETSDGSRVSASAGMGYEVSDNLSLRVDGIFTRRDFNAANQDIFLVNPNPANAIISPLSNPLSVGVVDYNDDGIEENVFLVSRILASDQTTAIGNRNFPSFDQSWAIYPQLNFENDQWRIDVIGTYSEAESFARLNQYDVRVRERGGRRDNNFDGIDDLGTGQTAIFDTGAGNLDQIFIRNFVPASLLTVTPGTGQNWSLESSTIGARFNVPTVSPSGSTFNSPVSFLIAGFTDEVARDVTSIDFDVARKFEGSVITEVAVGGFYSRENALRTRVENGVLGADFTALTDDVFRLNDGVSRGGEYLGGSIPGAELENFLSLDIPLVEGALLPITNTPITGITANFNAANLRSFFPELTNASAQSVTYEEMLAALPANPGTGYSQRLPQRRVIDDNYATARETVEAYAMLKFDVSEVSDFGLRGNIGGRYVRTDLSGSLEPISTEFYDNLAAIRAANGGAPLEFRSGAFTQFPLENNTFERFLPSVNLIYEITPNLVLRAAYYQTFEAFDLAEFSPSPTIIVDNEPGGDPDDPAAPINLGSDGNPIPSTVVDVSGLDISPRRSNAFDLGLSWYNRPGSVVSVGFFRKSLINDITRFRGFCPNGETLSFEGRTFTDLRTSLSGPNANQCVFTNDLGDEQRVRINVSQNNPDTINVTGFEAQIQQRLDFLPGPLENTGFVVNYTRVRSGGANDVQLFNVAEDTFNIIGYYEDDLFQARLAYNNQSEIQREGSGSFTGGSTLIAPRDQLDFSGAIKPARNFELRFEVFNITNSSRREYVGFEELLRVYEYDGRTYSMSATYRF